jgi:signal transduction histidine kinase/CheY-like chemotaxis protein
MSPDREDSLETRSSPDYDLRQERSLSRRIFALLLIASILLIGQSLYNLSNLDQIDESIITVQNTSDSLEELAREITTPISDIRMLSLESVLAPSQTHLESTTRELDRRVEELESRLAEWKERLGRGGADVPGLREFEAIRSAWDRYRDALSRTAHYIDEGIRVAAFISVTEQEKTHYENLQQALAAFGSTQLDLSQDVYDLAQEHSRVAFYTLVATSVVQIIVLFTILFLVYRMFRGYMRASQLHERELAQATLDAEQANRAKSAFLANMSHELRTPMNAILGYSEMLMEEAEEAEQEDFIPDLRKIVQAGKHLLALINDVLDLSKIESGRLDIFAEDFEVDRLIDELADTAQPLMVNNDNHFAIERGANLGGMRQDATKLRQSILNLLSNAAKFTRAGTVTLKVERSNEGGADWLHFDVRDTGIGIEEDKLESVFEEFSQADASTTRNYGGTGLGLAISRRFCRLLGGDLTATSRPGQGSTFRIRLPATIPSSDDSTDHSTDNSTGSKKTIGQSPDGAQHVAATTLSRGAPSPRASRTVSAPGSGPSVLVIDDDPGASEIIARLLERDGFRVVEAASGEEGLRLAREIHPVAITLDVMMPDMNGWAVLRALKADPELHRIPVVILTMLDDKTRGYSLGATDYLTKPVDRDRLHDALDRYRNPDGKPDEQGPVLLVEDDPDTRAMMVRLLEKADWRVIQAANGREALDRLELELPRLVLLDLMMPVMDGFDFLFEMRGHPEWEEIPVVVLTAKDLTPEEKQMLSSRVEETIEKGAYQQSELLALIRKVVNRHAPHEGGGS